MKVADTNGDKSWNHEVSVKVTDTNHKSCGHKPSWHVEMFAAKSVTSLRQTHLCHSNGIWCVTMHGKSQRHSLRQSPGQDPDKVVDLSQTQIMKIGNAICVTDFHDLCPREVRDFVGNLSRTLSQSRHNGIGLYMTEGPNLFHILLLHSRQLGQFQIVLLGDRGTCMWTICPKLLLGNVSARSQTNDLSTSPTCYR